MTKLDKAIAEVKALREHDEEIINQHKQRHVELHKAVDELFADFIKNHPNLPSYINLPIVDLIIWSAQQTNKPDHEDK